MFRLRPGIAVAGLLGLLVAFARGGTVMTGSGKPAPQSEIHLARSVVAAGGLLFVSAQSGLTPDPAAPSGTAIADQTRAALESLKRSLAAAGSSLADVVNVNVYLRYASDFDAMNAAYKTYFGEQPPARTTVAVALPLGELVELSAIAVPAGGSRMTMHPTGWVKSPRPYSYIVRTGDLVFLSGLVNRRGVDDKVVSGSVGTQVRTILDNASTLLRTAGLSLDNIVAARVFVTDDSEFEAMNDVYRQYFRTEPPARATAVAGLMGPDSAVEIQFIASSLRKETIGPQVSPTLPVSTAVRAGSRVFLAGVLGNTDANPDDPTGQMMEAMNHISHTLDLAGLTFADIVDSTLYVPDLQHLPHLDEVYGGFFPKEPPARTVIGAKLIARTGLVEILMTASK